MHNIMTYLDAKPIKKKSYKFNLTQSLLVKVEIQKLLKVKYIKSIDYPKWVSNRETVNCINGYLQIYTGFYYLNKAYPKDEFPFLNIDILINNTMSYEMLSLMDDFSSYNQIWVNPDDRHKINFTIPWGNYYYKVIPFGLNNAGMTYQHTMTYIFHDMMHDIVENYIDDLLTRFATQEGYWDVLHRVF